MPYSLDLRQLQAPIKERYRTEPASALVVTEACSAPSDLDDPRHCAVAPAEFPDLIIRAGLHPAAGGAGDTPCSGDILAAALAICEESTLRSVAANMGVELESVEVDVKIHWDFRGTMGIDREVARGGDGHRDAIAGKGQRGCRSRARQASAGQRRAVLLDAANAA